MENSTNTINSLLERLVEGDIEDIAKDILSDVNKNYKEFKEMREFIFGRIADLDNLVLEGVEIKEGDRFELVTHSKIGKFPFEIGHVVTVTEITFTGGIYLDSGDIYRKSTILTCFNKLE